MADDARADGVAVEADEQVEKRSAVADLDVARTVEVDGGERFLGEVERVEVALFVSQIRVWFQVGEGNPFFGCERIFR